jgi:hypothetical protein
MELNHRFLVVIQASWPLDHGTVVLEFSLQAAGDASLAIDRRRLKPGLQGEWTHRDSHPDSRLAGPVSCLLDDEPP